MNIAPSIAPAVTDESLPHNGNSGFLKKLLIGGGLLTAAITVAPHLLPLINIGATESTLLLTQCSSNLAQSASLYGTGISGWASAALSHVPLIGESLAHGSYTASIVSGVVGTGGAFLSHYLHKNAGGKTGIRWGNVIKTACLLTSAFIALPVILPALGMGISYIALMVGGASMAGFAAGTVATLGVTAASVGSVTSSWGVAGLVVPHLISCGLTFGSAALSLFGGGKEKERSRVPATTHGDTHLLSPASPVFPQGFAGRIAENRRPLAAGMAR